MVLFLIKVFFFFNIFISQMGSFDTLNLIGSSFLVRVNWTFYDSKKIWVLKWGLCKIVGAYNPT